MRKLACAALSYSAFVFLAQYILPREWTPYFAAALLLSAVLFWFFLRERRRVILMITISACIALFWSHGHYRIFIAPGEALNNVKTTVTGRVTGFPETADAHSSVKIRLTGPDTPGVNMILYSYDSDFDGLRPGDLIEAEVKIKTSAFRDNQETGIFTSKGIYLLGYQTGGYSVTGRWPFSFVCFPLYAAQAIKESVQACFPADVSHFFIALQTGDTGRLRQDRALYGDMGRAGILHVVAVSGMHISFLTGFVRIITRRRRMTAFICGPMIIFFIIMTGASPSVIRSGFMQLALLTAPLLKRESDSLTSLSAVLALLLLQNPSAAMSVGLQLSFSAMAGIILLSQRVHDGLMRAAKIRGLLQDKRIAACIGFVINCFSSALGAVVFSMPLAALHFGYISLVSPITNLLTLGVISLCFIGGYIAAILGLIFPLGGTLLAWLIAWPARYALGVFRLLADLRFAALYTENNLISWWLIFAYLLFGVFIFLSRKKGFRPVMPAALSVCCLCAALLLTAVPGESGQGQVTVLDVGQGQSILLMSGRATVVIDCGGDKDAGERVSRYISAQGRDRVDLLVLTHLHADHANGVPALLHQLDIRRIALPVDDEEEILHEILSLAETGGTEILYIADDTEITAGKLAMTLYAPIGSASTNERGIIIQAAVSDFDLLVTGDVDSLTERRFLARYDLPEMEMLMAGHHGSKYATSQELVDKISPQIAVVSVGKNSYGHPTTQVLERLHESGAKVYRTDLFGHVEILLNAG